MSEIWAKIISGCPHVKAEEAELSALRLHDSALRLDVSQNPIGTHA